MKKNNFKFINLLPYCLFIFISFAVFFCSYFYPTSRDDFYFLRHDFIPAWQEYYNAYFFSNPRIGQFFTNLAMRNNLYKGIYGLVLFYCFFNMVFLNVFRRFPRLNSTRDLVKLITIIGSFAFLIFVFGEMFFYASFSGNYTLSLVFYLLIIYILTEYYIFDRNWFTAKGWLVLPVVFIGVFTGMCNEHVPPVIIALSFFASIFYIVKKKKVPDWRILSYQFSIIIGYIILFFAPANSVKFQAVGKKEMRIGLGEYLHNFKNVLNYYRYFTPELCIVSLLAFLLLIYLFAKNRLAKQYFFLVLVFLILGLSTIPIMAYAPMSGTRLLFFSNVMFFLIVLVLFFKTELSIKASRVLEFTSCIFALLFFLVGVKVVGNAHNNYVGVLQEIAKKKKASNNVELNNGFYYYDDEFGSLNRRFLLDTGEEYIDDNPNKDNSKERSLKNYFHIEKLSVKKEHYEESNH